jgi:hypothetical protein
MPMRSLQSESCLRIPSFAATARKELYNNAAKTYLTKSAVEHHSAKAKYVMGMLDCFEHGCARSKPDMLETAR